MKTLRGTMARKAFMKAAVFTILCFQLFMIRTSIVFAEGNKNTINSNDSIIADVAEKRIGSVVNISSTKIIKAQEGQQHNPLFSDPFFQQFFGHEFNTIPRERREKSLGSGVIVSKEGKILLLIYRNERTFYSVLEK